MAYNLIKTDGSALATVADGQIDATSTSLTLVGKNYPGYGQFLNENIIKMLENFSNSSAPTAPLQGQIWFNSATKILSAYASGAWKSISGAQNQADEPVNKVAGDFWFDSVNQQLKVWSGAAWILIGPSFTSATGASGAFAETITDASQFTHVVVKFLVQNKLIAVLSKDAAFTPAVAITGFPVINPGLNLASSSGLVFYADAYNSQRLGGVLANKFARTDQEPTFASGVIISSPSAGLEIRHTDAVTQDFTLNAAANKINFTAEQTGVGVKFSTHPTNNNGSAYDALLIDATTGEVTVGHTSPTQNKGVATKSYVDTGVANAYTHADSVSTTLRSYTNVLWANANVTYSNVRTIQSALGMTGSQTDFNKIVTGTPGSYTTTFASNVVNIWGQLGTILGNVLSGYTVGVTPIRSLWGNVQALTDRTKTLEDGTLKADGTVTVKGVLRPDITNTQNLGTSSARYATFFGNTVDSGTLVNLTNVSTVTPLPSTDNAKRTAGQTALNLYGNVNIVGNLNFNQTSGITGSVAGITSPVFFYGNVTNNADILPLVDNARNIGSSTKRYQNVYAVTFRGTATSAQYADVAERYAADYTYPVGTLVQIGGTAEITMERDELSEHVLGVISSNPAYLMNCDAGDHQSHPPVAMVGRTPVRTIGRAVKGDRLVSAGNGIARRAEEGEATHFNVIGRALADKYDTGEGLLEAVILITM